MKKFDFKNIIKSAFFVLTLFLVNRSVRAEIPPLEEVINGRQKAVYNLLPKEKQADLEDFYFLLNNKLGGHLGFIELLDAMDNYLFYNNEFYSQIAYIFGFNPRKEIIFTKNLKNFILDSEIYNDSHCVITLKNIHSDADNLTLTYGPICNINERSNFHLDPNWDYVSIDYRYYISLKNHYGTSKCPDIDLSRYVPNIITNNEQRNCWGWPEPELTQDQTAARTYVRKDRSLLDRLHVVEFEHCFTCEDYEWLLKPELEELRKEYEQFYGIHLNITDEFVKAIANAAEEKNSGVDLLISLKFALNVWISENNLDNKCGYTLIPKLSVNSEGEFSLHFIEEDHS